MARQIGGPLSRDVGGRSLLGTRRGGGVGGGGLAVLDRLQQLVTALDGRYELEIEGLSQPNAIKLAVLGDTGRPFLEVTPRMKSMILRTLKQSLSAVLQGGRFDTESALDIAGAEAKEIVIKRFEEQGFDVHLDPLDPEYLEHKRRKRLDSRIGIATGTLLRNLKRARFVWRRA